ncbi:stage V sporulation protein D [Propionispora vibrioides]|uniref:Stage V sporulation protein D (Sporulation-specific penicillin-binding protein) n=1 Tax=Propionispora vibrioides TaxID=112903 RepID=A0A1H8P5Q0_9FIRM|nr:stage V sporulation protein D [Propionispora vibrioides]SEO37269.1 stage V sporulation protein D (sporulation-specific penicillin-binding protein) [Propionispora vibrioides]
MPLITHVVVRKRVACLLLLVGFVMAALCCRLLYLQFYKSEWLTENATDQRVRDIPVEAKRGIIFDRNGKELGVSISSDSVYAIPAEIRDVEDTAAKLAAILVLDNNKLVKQLKKRQAFTWIERKVGSDQAKAIKALNLPGIGLTEESRRYYPHDNVAAHVLGFTGIDSQGLDGVEITFDSYLKGRPGSIVVEYDARGREIPYAVHKFMPPTDGNNIYLTIDLIIQQIAERELDKVMKETGAKAATMVAIKPQTGEVLALANRPDYDPNHFADFSPKLWRNIAVSNAYEPGSTFKIITTAAALGEGVVKLSDRFFDPGEVEVQGRIIHCWKDGGHGSQSFEEVIENSCNVGFVNVGLKLGIEPFYRYLQSFGFGKATDIDLPGEAKGILINSEQAKAINIATMAMGQSIAVTPIQLATAVAAVANDGQLLRPQIVREVRDKNGQILRDFKPDSVKQVIDPAVAKEVKGVLEKVVEEGTGKNAFLEGFRVAGKTGTAQKVGGGGYMPGKYVASFVGFAPADDPQVVLLVIIDEPVGMYYGGQIAAPVFGSAMKDILQYLQVQPKLAEKPTGVEQKPHVDVPGVINLLPDEAKAQLAKLDLTGIVEENGERIVDQIPKPGSKVPAGSKVLLYTSTPRYNWSEVTVPDCQGLSGEEAARILGEIGLSVRPVGDSKAQVTSQEPPVGSKVPSGSIVTVYFE